MPQPDAVPPAASRPLALRLYNDLVQVLDPFLALAASLDAGDDGADHDPRHAFACLVESLHAAADQTLRRHCDALAEELEDAHGPLIPPEVKQMFAAGGLAARGVLDCARGLLLHPLPGDATVREAQS